MESGASCKTTLKWFDFHVLLFNLVLHFSLLFFQLAISYRSAILANVNITLKKLLTANTQILIEEIHSFYYEEKYSGLFLVVKQTLPGNIMLRIFINFVFDFQAILLFTKIAQSHLYYLSTSLALKLLLVLSTSFLPCGSLVKVVQLFKNFPMIYSMIIFRKNIFFNTMGPRVQNPPFSFFCSS